MALFQFGKKKDKQVQLRHESSLLLPTLPIATENLPIVLPKQNLLRNLETSISRFWGRDVKTATRCW